MPGLRYDVQKFAKPDVRNPDPQLAAAGIDTSVLPTDTNNWAPRLGVAWSPAGRKYVVRAGYGLFYGRTPSIMVGTAHSNNGINVQTITFTGSHDAASTRPSSRRCRPARRCRRPTIFTFSIASTRTRRIQQASAGFEWEVMRDTTSRRHRYLRRDGRPAATLDRPERRRRRRRRRYTVAGTGEHAHATTDSAPVRSPTSRASSRSRARPSREYNGLTIELNRRFANRVSARAGLHARQGRRHGARRDGRRPGQFDRRCEVRVEPEGLRRRSHRRQQRPAASLRVQRDLRHQGWRPAGRLALPRPRLDVQHDLHGVVRPAVLGARRQRRPEQRRQHAQRLRAGHDAEPVQRCRSYYSLDLRVARSIPVVAATCAVQPIFEVFNLLTPTTSTSSTRRCTASPAPH